MQASWLEDIIIETLTHENIYLYENAEIKKRCLLQRLSFLGLRV